VGWRVFCHEVHIDSIRPRRRLAAGGLVGEPDACRPEMSCVGPLPTMRGESADRKAQGIARAIKPEQHKAANGHREETVRSGFFAHGTAPFASPLKQTAKFTRETRRNLGRRHCVWPRRLSRIVQGLVVAGDLRGRFLAPMSGPAPSAGFAGTVFVRRDMLK
jgi:hypothetical protein